MKILIVLLVFNLLALSLGQSFFDSYVKNFLENIFSTGRNPNNGNPNGPNRGNPYGSNSFGNNPYGGNSNNGNNGRPPARDIPSGGSMPNLRPPNCDCSLQNDNRIVGGKVGQFVPWLVSLGYIFKNSRDKINYSHFCGGSILNSQTILTAGHCLKDLNKSSVSNYLIRFGLTDLNEPITKDNTVQWADFTINENYARDSSDNDNDIGIIKLKKPIDLRNSKAKPACLDFSKNYPQFLSLSGWGRTTSFGRHNQTGATLPTKLLELDMSEDKSKSANYIISAVGKAKNSGTCSADSGSPLQAKSSRKTSVVGLVSYGISNAEGVFCLSNTGFVRLGAHSKFIENSVGAQNFCRA